MGNYEILKNRLSDHKYIIFAGDTMPKRLLIDRTKFLRKGGKYKFKAMKMSDGNVHLWVLDKYSDNNMQLLKRIETADPVGEGDFDKIYSIAVNWLNS